MQLSQRGIQARIERGESNDDLHPDNNDDEAIKIKSESLNMISSYSAGAPEPVANQVPEPVAATSLTFKYDADVPAARRESPETLIERLHHRIMACLVREMQLERVLKTPPLSSTPAWISLDQVQNPVLIAYVHGDHQTTLAAYRELRLQCKP